MTKSEKRTLVRMRMISKRKSRFTDLSIFEDREYISIVGDILTHPKFHEMQQYLQHGTTSCQEHCIQVSYNSYLIAKKLNADYTTCARAGLLHDLFLYDWHGHIERTGDFFHGITHPRTALTHACHYFKLNEHEMDGILKHMWPLTIIPPKHISGYIISLVDKTCTISEVILKQLEKLA